MRVDDPPDATATTPPSDEELTLWQERFTTPYVLDGTSHRFFVRCVAEVIRLRAELARVREQYRLADEYNAALIMGKVRMPPPGMTPARPFGVGPTCPNGCDIAGPNIVYGEMCDVCGARLV